MEHHHPSSLISPSLPFFLFSSLIFILFISQVLKLFAKKSKATIKKTKPNLPPGPRTLPIIGSIHHFIGKSLPHHCMRDLARKYGPLMHLKLGETSVMVVSSPEVAKEVFKTYDINFSERPQHLGTDILTYGSMNIATSRYGGYWKQLRKIATMELLSPKRVSSFKSIRKEEVMKLITWISANNGSCVNLSKKVASLTSAITARATFGGKCKEQEQEQFISLLKKLGEIVERVFVVFSLFPSHKWLHYISGIKRKAEKVHKEFDVVIEKIIREKIKRMKNDGDEYETESLLSILLNIVEDRGDYEYPMTINSAKAIVFDLFGAGIETSSGVIEWTMSELMKNPRAMARAQQEVRIVFGINGFANESPSSSSLEKLIYLKAVIKETMRLHPPFPLLLPRECRETCQINGYTIAAGTQVIVNAWAIGRDPKHWGGEEDAEIFRPERFLESSIDYNGSNVEFIPFGSGRRMCPGIYFAVASIESCVAQLLYYFDWKVPEDGEMDMSEYFGSTARRKNDLILVPIPWKNK